MNSGKFFLRGTLFLLGCGLVLGLFFISRAAAGAETQPAKPSPIESAKQPAQTLVQPSLETEQEEYLAEEEYSVDEYVLGPGDTIQVSIWGQMELTVTRYRVQALPDFTVSVDGKIFIPVLGQIQAAGRTFAAVRQTIIDRLSIYYHDVNISVILRSMASFRVFVLGEVSVPSLYPTLPSPTFGNPSERRLLNFIAMAGGFRTTADISNVQIIRRDNKTGEEKIIKADVFKLIQENDLSQNILIKKGDTILVPQKINSVYVLGEVSRPGAYAYVVKAKLLDYISQAGGVRDTAAASNIGVIRGEGDQAQVIQASLNDLIKWGRYGPTFPIASGDIIYVPKNFIANWNDILSILRLTQASLDAPRSVRRSWDALQESFKSGTQ